MQPSLPGCAVFCMIPSVRVAIAPQSRPKPLTERRLGGGSMLPLHRHATAALALGALLTLTACDSMSLEGKLFDWMGVSGSALDAKASDPKMDDRAPLVVPPKLTRLPEPGSGKTTDTSLAALDDPELKKAASAKER